MRTEPFENRRCEPRYRVSPMYTPVTLCMIDGESTSAEGHAYDLSASGMQFELDRAIEPGTPVALQVTLPTGGAMWDDLESSRSLMVIGSVVWADDSEPGPARMAVAFERFVRLGDQERLARQLGSGRFAKAA